MLGSGDVSLAISITSVSGSKSLVSFTNRFFHFSGPPGFRVVFYAADRNGRFGRIKCQRSEVSSSRGKRKRRVFLCRRTVRVKVTSKVIPASFLKIERGRILFGAKDQRERGTDGRSYSLDREVIRLIELHCHNHSSGLYACCLQTNCHYDIYLKL